MIRKFVSMGCLVAACLLSPPSLMAGAPVTPADPQSEISASLPAAEKSPLVEDKFRKLQKEMEGENADLHAQSAGSRSKTADNKSLSSPEPRSVVSLAFQILAGLIFVLLLAVVTIRVLKRLQGRMLAKPGKTGGNFFEVLETCHLGTNQRVVALRINEEVGVLGVTPQGISLLTVLKEPASEVRQAYARESNAAAFSDNLNKLLDRFKKPKRVSDLLDEVQ